MSGRRHHYLPRFLQRPFSHCQTKGIESVFVHRREKSFRSNLMGVGQERDFYGNSKEQFVDEEITRSEPALAAILQTLNGDNAENVSPDDMALLISAIAVRTKAMRKALINFTPILIRETASQFDDIEKISRVLRAQVKNHDWLNKIVDAELKKHPALPREAKARLRMQLKNKVKMESSNSSSQYVLHAQELIQSILQTLQETATDIADHAYVQALTRDPRMPKRVEWLKDFHFRILTGEFFILGDCGVVSLHSDGHSRLAMAATDDSVETVAFLLPISPTRCVLASRDFDYRAPLTSEINEWSASLSCEFFITQANEAREFDYLRSLINTAAPIDTEETIKRCLRE